VDPTDFPPFSGSLARNYVPSGALLNAALLEMLTGASGVLETLAGCAGAATICGWGLQAYERER
jgi:hypothetical protein